MIRWDDFFPINTFWGGFLAAYKESTSSVTLGYALRAGWTKQWKLGGDLIGAAAELGVAIGGVLIVKFTWNKELSRAIFQPPPHLEYSSRIQHLRRPWEAALAKSMAGKKQSLETIRRSQSRIETILNDLTRANVEMDGTVFADVWGNASATVFGVRVASIEIAGRVRLHIETFNLTITRAEAFLGFTFELKIGCFTVEAEGSVTFVFIDNPQTFFLNNAGHVVHAPRRLTELTPAHN